MKKVIALKYFSYALLGHIAFDVAHRIYLIFTDPKLSAPMLIGTVILGIVEAVLIYCFILKRIDNPSKAFLIIFGVFKVASVLLVLDLMEDELIRLLLEIAISIGLLTFGLLKYNSKDSE